MAFAPDGAVRPWPHVPRHHRVWFHNWIRPGNGEVAAYERALGSATVGLAKVLKAPHPYGSTTRVVGPELLPGEKLHVAALTPSHSAPELVIPGGGPLRLVEPVATEAGKELGTLVVHHFRHAIENCSDSWQLALGVALKGCGVHVHSNGWIWPRRRRCAVTAKFWRTSLAHCPTGSRRRLIAVGGVDSGSLHVP